MKIIFSGGGTGGHIYPALTLIETIKEKYPQAEILYVGTKKGLEADIVPKADIPFATINIEGFARKLSLHNLVVVGKAAMGLLKARRIIKKFSPDVVVGTGGYVSGPLLMMAALMKIPTLIQDQNAIPGLTNKILAKFVTKIACGYESACKFFPADKVQLTGNPIRKDVLSYTRSEAIKKLKLDPAKKTLLVTGGSRGARRINEAMLDVYKSFANSDKLQILHITGKTEYERFIDGVKRENIDLAKVSNIQIKPYLYNMPQALAAADVIVSRAGAIGLAEITARGLASILVPYPYAAENHQEYNARALVNAKAAKMILNKELNGQVLIVMLEDLLQSPADLLQIAQNSKKMGYPQASDNIVSMIVSIIK